MNHAVRRIGPFLALLGVLVASRPASAQISIVSKTTLRLIPRTEVAYDSKNHVYMILAENSPTITGLFLDKDGNPVKDKDGKPLGEFLISQENPIPDVGPYTGWTNIEFGCTGSCAQDSDAAFLVTYLAAVPGLAPKMGRLIRYQAGQAPTIGAPFKIADVNNEWYAADCGRTVWNNGKFVVGTRVPGVGGDGSFARVQVNQVDMAGNVSTPQLLSNDLDYDGSPAIACAPDGTCLAIGYAWGAPFGQPWGGTWARVFSSSDLKPLTDVFYLDPHDALLLGQKVTYNAKTGKFLGMYLRGTDMVFRTVSATSPYDKGPLDYGKNFGPGAGDDVLAFNAATGSSLLVSKWSPPTNPGADLYMVELGADGYDGKTPVLLTPWDGFVQGYVPAMGTNAVEGRWMVMYGLLSGQRATIVQGTLDILPASPDITLSGDLAFGSITQNQTATRTLTIANTGASTITVNSISYPSGFSGAWTGTIAAGASQDVTVTFAPLSADTYSGTIKVNTNGTNTNTISVSGTGVAVPHVNVALAANGATALASSTYSSNYPASAAIDGDRKGLNWAAGGGWNDQTKDGYPDWLEVDFASPQTIDEIDVFGIQDNYASPVDPTSSMTGTAWGLKAFEVQYWNGTAWQTVTGGSVTGNTLVWRRFVFTAVSTSKIRVSVTDAAGYSRITEVEAWSPSDAPPPTPTRIVAVSGNLAFGNVQVGSSSTRTLTISNTGNSALTVTGITYPTGFTGAWSGTISVGGSQNVTVTFTPTEAVAYSGTVTVAGDQTSGTNTTSASGTGTTAHVNVALGSNGARAVASSTHSTGYPATGVIDGDRQGLGWGSGGGWNDATDTAFPDWVEVDFAGAQTIDQIDVFTVQNNWSKPVEPTASTLADQWGIRAFELQYWADGAWQTVPGATVTGNTLAWREFTFTAISTSKIRLYITDAASRYSRVVEVEAWSPSPALPTPVKANVALESNGATAVASSSYSSSYMPVGAIDGDRTGLGWGGGHGWNDATEATFPDWLEVDFAGAQTINEVDVFTVQDTWWSPTDPTPTMPATMWGLRNFEVQYWTGTAWQAIPGATVTGNTLVWQQFTFSAITTTKIRVYVTDAAAKYSRIVEVEAWNSSAILPPPRARSNVALATNGGSTTASSSYSSGYPSSAVIDGDRKGLAWSAGGGWNDATNGAFPDWLEVDFATAQTIDEIDVFTLQDAWSTPGDPTPSMTAAYWGVRAFEVQYWTGSAWQAVPGGTVTGNGLVWRQFIFSDITTTKIRIVVNDAPGFSRLVEVEAWTPR